MTKVVIASIPFVDSIEPIMAPALLTAILKKHEINSVGLDLNIHVVNTLRTHRKAELIKDFLLNQEIHSEVIDDICKIIDDCVESIIKYNPTVIGLSLLIFTCRTFCKWLCASLKQKLPNAKIVIGGTGIQDGMFAGNLSFCEKMRELKLIDDYIIGDGENALVEYVKGNINYPGINSQKWESVVNLNDYPYPDYDNYELDLYDYKCIPIVDSKGCVRKCEFCDVIEHYPKFAYRTADLVFDEMLYQSKKYNCSHFSFRNALTNGNLKEFKKWISQVANYNRGVSEKERLSWRGYFIIRPSSHHPEEMWKDLADTGAHLLLGVESVIEHVRRSMGKAFANEDIDWHLQMARKYKVPVTLLMIAAYPTETLEDFETTKKWFRDRKDYANNSVEFINLSFASILPNTKLAKKKDEMGIDIGERPNIWFNQNLKITSEERFRYTKELVSICSNECNFVVGANDAS